MINRTVFLLFIQSEMIRSLSSILGYWFTSSSKYYRRIECDTIHTLLLCICDNMIQQMKEELNEI